MTRPPAPTNEERLRQACDTVGYEYGVFQDSALVGLFQATTVSILNTVAIEAMVMHMRNLIDFFYNEDPSRKSEYVLAEHFFTSPQEWRPHRTRSSRIRWGRASETISVAELSGLANATATHMTWSRLDTSKARWCFGPLLRHFDGLMRRFVQQAPPSVITLVEAEPQWLPNDDPNDPIARYESRFYSPLVVIDTPPD